YTVNSLYSMFSLYQIQGCFCSFSADEIMQQEIRPLLAVDIIEQLQKQFAILSGGRSKDGAPIITFPEYSTFPDLPDQDFLNVLTYLTSIPRGLSARTHWERNSFLSFRIVSWNL
uniref:Uncharacterized protein n=1 Tax=Callorhinchus milii TaxID=7868 RepID=A0A4W3HH59_CALMI